MAPKKPKQPSMLTRQRQLRNQQQQVKRASSNQLPPSGGTSANRPKAVAQRTATAVGQRVTQDVATIRALADNMRRNQARADRQIPADKPPSTRRVGPGGANPKPQGQLPPGQRGGQLRTRGGALATRPSGGALGKPGNTVQPVRVRDMGNTRRPQLTGQRDLPGGTGGGDLARTQSPRRSDAQARQNRAAAGSTGPNRVGQPAGSANRMYGAGRVNAAVDRALKSSRSIRPGSGTAAAVVGALGEMALGPVARAAGQKLGEALRPVGRAIDDARPGMNSKNERSRKSNTSTQTRFPQARRNAQVRTERIKAGIPDTPTASSTAPTRSGPSSGSPTRTTSSGGSGRSSAPRSTTPSTSSDAGIKNQDKNYRGNVFEKTFGYKPGEAPDQVKSKPSSFDTKSDTYTPTTKVDGSKLNAMKIDQKKVDEYKRRKDRYYS